MIRTRINRQEYVEATAAKRALISPINSVNSHCKVIDLVMKHLVRSLWLLSVALSISCENGVRDLDFINKQFQVTYNIDSTRTLDSTRLDALRNSKAVYNFSEGGKGTTHIQTGMLSNDIPFTWRFENDSLFINKTAYGVQKQDKGLVIRNDSVKMVLSPQK
ncbi:hypothetical protein [Spirosoma sp.]|uniref:hypothetical protein n=1 Tax=Spirosoma sp. TaxID=1899569 RepID=UPI003B3B4FDA